jgi:hypothetical protein
MLVLELGVDHAHAWRDALAAAIEALSVLGYEIHLRDGSLTPRPTVTACVSCNALVCDSAALPDRG